MKIRLAILSIALHLGVLAGACTVTFKDAFSSSDPSAVPDKQLADLVPSGQEVEAAEADCDVNLDISCLRLLVLDASAKADALRHPKSRILERNLWSVIENDPETARLLIEYFPLNADLSGRYLQLGMWKEAEEAIMRWPGEILSRRGDKIQIFQMQLLDAQLKFGDLSGALITADKTGEYDPVFSYLFEREEYDYALSIADDLDGSLYRTVHWEIVEQAQLKGHFERALNSYSEVQLLDQEIVSRHNSGPSFSAARLLISCLSIAEEQHLQGYSSKVVYETIERCRLPSSAGGIWSQVFVTASSLYLELGDFEAAYRFAIEALEALKNLGPNNRSLEIWAPPVARALIDVGEVDLGREKFLETEKSITDTGMAKVREKNLIYSYMITSNDEFIRDYGFRALKNIDGAINSSIDFNVVSPIFVKKYSRNIIDLNGVLTGHFSDGRLDSWLKTLVKTYIAAGDFSAAEALIISYPQKSRDLLKLVDQFPDADAERVLAELYEASRLSYLADQSIDAEWKDDGLAAFVAKVGAAQVARGFDQDGLQSLRLSYELAKQSKVFIRAIALTEIANAVQQFH